MARIQILELPTEHHGDDMITPFILVIDQVPTDEPYFDAFRRDLEANEIAARTGARHVLVFEDTIDIPANEVPLDADGYPIRVHVEGEFEKFREQVQDEINKAAAQLRQGLQ